MKKILITFLSFAFGCNLFAQKIDNVEPPCWWTGMKTDLQLLVHGQNIGQYTKATVLEKGIKVSKVNKAESPNYLFLDISFPITGAKAGEYTIKLTKADNLQDSIVFKYNIYQRRNGSAKRESFTKADVIYLLMPDRFSNGDPSINNVSGYADKYARNEYFGRHGGDIRGIINHLDYIADLGATAIWSTPMTEDNEPNSSYHGYACSNYYKIDPRYGTNDIYKEYVEKAHAKGLKIIMDVVTNHCSTKHWWMNDLPFNDWINQFPVFTKSNYVLTANYDPNASKKDLELCTRGWFDTSMPDMNLQNPYVLQYFKQLFVWWIEWANLDGLRVDTFPYNDKNAIAQWGKAIRKEYPNISIVGECWLNEPSLVSYWEGDRHNGDKYNSYLTHVMDFPLQGAITHAVNKDSEIGWGEGMTRIYNSLANDFLYERPGDLMIFLDNHDTERWADAVKGDTKKIKMGIAMLATLRGMPQIYYGTELGLVSKDLKFGHGSARVDFPGGWSVDSLNLFNQTHRNAAQQEIFNYTKKLLNYRKNSEVLKHGKNMHFNPLDNEYSYVRYNNKNAVLVYVNGSTKDHSISWDRYSEVLGKYPSGRNVITGATVYLNESITVKPKEVLIVEF